MARKNDGSATCAQCLYFIAPPRKSRAGVCKRYPPILIAVVVETDEVSFSQPLVDADDLCGEFKGKQ